MNPYLGQIMMFAGNFAINGWATCDGQTLAISTNNALFAILGTTYGGNGQTTFLLPDLRGRVPLHQGQAPGGGSYVLGQADGTESVTLLANQMPMHKHAVNADGQGGGKTTRRATFSERSGRRSRRRSTPARTPGTSR
jgi:microcystin-dependent protein